MTPAQSTRSRTPLVVLALFAAIGVGAAVTVAQGDSPPAETPAAVALGPGVVKEVRDRLGDPHARVGRLDCVTFANRRGSCLADLVSRRRYNVPVMIAVTYHRAPDGSLRRRVRLP